MIRIIAHKGTLPLRIQMRIRFWRRRRFYVVGYDAPVELGPFHTFCEAWWHHQVAFIASSGEA